MWISRKRWEAVEKRIADLELQVQSQQEKLEAFCNLWIERQKMRSKASPNIVGISKPYSSCGLVFIFTFNRRE